MKRIITLSMILLIIIINHQEQIIPITKEQRLTKYLKTHSLRLFDFDVSGLALDYGLLEIQVRRIMYDIGYRVEHFYDPNPPMQSIFYYIKDDSQKIPDPEYHDEQPLSVIGNISFS